MDTKKKVNLQNKVPKGIKDPLVIIVARQVIHLTDVGAMVKENSMVNVSIAISMVTKPMNAMKNQSLKANVINARNKVTRHLNADLSHSIQQNKSSKQYLVGTTTLGADVTIVENMDTLEQTVEGIT